MSVILLTFFAVFLAVVAAALLVGDRRQIRSRVATAVRLSSDTPTGLFASLFRRPLSESVGMLVDPLQKLVPRSQQEMSVVRKRLMLAGLRKPFDFDLFYAAKALCPVTCVLIVTATGTFGFGSFFAYSLALGLGFLLPDFWLGNRIKTRKINIELGLAEALDLMVVCVEAGLGLDQTIQRVAQELRLSQPEISEELRLVHLEQRAGRSSAEAWRSLADRTDLDSVRAIVAMLVQADQFGTSVATCLRVHSDSLRTQRRQRAEEQAAKTTVKLVFPLVFFIFPSLFLVVLGPSMIMLMDAFDKYLLN